MELAGVTNGMTGALATTLLARPYVVVFLLAFLVIGWLNRGPARTLFLLVAGYAVAFLSEWASIRWGFPYGDYVYLYDAMRGELILGGVPVWDSLSYSFLAYASYETACYLGWRYKVLGGAFLMTWADVVIDPVALQGERWFLGQVYTYPDGGVYFGVPLSNFAGWFLVALTILVVYELGARRLVHSEPPLRAPWLGPAFYYGILTFILVVAISIGEYGIAAASLLLHTPIVILLIRRSGDVPIDGLR